MLIYPAIVSCLLRESMLKYTYISIKTEIKKLFFFPYDVFIKTKFVIKIGDKHITKGEEIQFPVGVMYGNIVYKLQWSGLY